MCVAALLVLGVAVVPHHNLGATKTKGISEKQPSAMHPQGPGDDPLEMYHIPMGSPLKFKVIAHDRT